MSQKTKKRFLLVLPFLPISFKEDYIKKKVGIGRKW